MYSCLALNKINALDEIEFVSPQFVSLKVLPQDYQIINPETGLKLNWVCDSHPCVLYISKSLPEATLLRTLDPDYIEGQIRDTGR